MIVKKWYCGTGARKVCVTLIASMCIVGIGWAESEGPPTESPEPKAQSQEPRAQGQPSPQRPRVKVDPDTGLPPGMPDFRGVWTNRWIVDMADGRYVEKTVEVPFTDKGRAIYAERTGSLQKDDPNLKCWPSGLPRQGGTPYPLKIMQTPDEFVILYEGGMHTFRIIPTDGRPHKEDPWLWYGDSVGRWEGDTLVVDTIGFNDKSWLDSSGYPHGEKLHLVERFRKTDPQTLRYEVTIEDPEYYTRPWTTAWTYRFSPATEMMEYFCTENERDRERMVGK
jgi:hypothetical protein